MTDEVGIRLGELEEIIAEEDGYSAESDAEVLLSGMGLDPSIHTEKMPYHPHRPSVQSDAVPSSFWQPRSLDP
jgi:hypothetical protein